MRREKENDTFAAAGGDDRRGSERGWREVRASVVRKRGGGA